MYYFKLNFLIAIFISTLGTAFAKNNNTNDGTYEIEIQEKLRSYNLRFPTSNNNQKAIIVLHGGGGNANQIEKSSKFTDSAIKQGYVVVYPNGTSKTGAGILGAKMLTWNAVHCCGYAKEEKINDIKFLEAIINELKNNYNIKGIYITGISNGAMMAYQSAIHLNNKINAIAPVAGSLFIDEKELYKNQVSVIIINGMKDESVPYQGGYTNGKFSKSWDKIPLNSIDNTFQFFVKPSKCSNLYKTETETYFKSNTSCENKVEIQSYLIKEGNHSWYGAERRSIIGDKPIKDFNATETIIDFFNKH